MTVRFSQRFLRQYAEAPAEVRRAFDKQVARDWRFYFTIEDGAYHLHQIVRHPK
jgi:hypothetical protein